MATITGDGNDNTLTGTPGNDLINGLGGNDSIDGGAGNDTIHGQSGNDSITGGGGDDRIFGGLGDDTLSGIRGRLQSDEGNDEINAIAQRGTGQIHIYAGTGNDKLNLYFNAINSALNPSSQGQIVSQVSHGHHARGGEGADDFHFRNTANVSHTVVGRIEDFDSSRDNFYIDGHYLNLNTLQTNANVIVHIVEYGGEQSLNGGGFSNPADTQQWLLIETANDGYIFYALEGARAITNTGTGANSGDQEHHFLLTMPDFDDLIENHSVAYVDPVDYIPFDTINNAEYTPEAGGLSYNDTDANLSEANTLINVANGTASNFGDVIAAGLNNDTVQSGGGNDRVWGGSGHDALVGGTGDDTLYGGTGNDTLWGQDGSDAMHGGHGNDRMLGGNGNDLISGNVSNDVMFGENGNDRLIGGSGHDRMNGGAGFDTLEGGTGNDVMVGGGNADTFVFADGFGRDAITDFDALNSFERIDLTGHSDVTYYSDISNNMTQDGANVLININGTDVIELRNVNINYLGWSDFVF